MKDDDFMRLAIAEARKGIGLTSPNPAVGAVIVKDGEVIAKGWHKKAGELHAEREAILNAVSRGKDLCGGTVYVTLEPCSTHGTTGACTDTIIEYGFSALIRGFSKRMQTGLPWVIAKSAMSLDGRITRPDGEGQWLTGAEARAEAHQIRAEVDGIVVGGKTVRRDNPSLTIRGDAYRKEKEQPWRAVLTQSGKKNIPAESIVLTDDFKDRTLLLEDLSLEDSLRKLAEKGCNVVLLECGGVLMRQFLEQGLVDEVAVFFAPMLTGGADFGFGVGEHLKKSMAIDKVQVKQLGDDLLFRGLVK